MAKNECGRTYNNTYNNKEIKMIQINIGRDTYKSISSAWRALSPRGLAMITVRWRLNNGWNIKDAFLITAVEADKRRTFADVRNR